MLVLIVDDINIIRSGIIAAMRARYTDFSFAEAENGAQALELTKQQEVDLIITDIKMPVCDGLELIAALRQHGFAKPIVILSGFGEFEYAKRAMDFGVSGYLLKPIENEKLYSVVDAAVSQVLKERSIHYMRAENEQLSEQNRHARMSHALQNAILFSAPLENFPQLAGKNFCLALLSIEKDFCETTCFLESELELVRYAIQNIVDYLELELPLCLIKHPSEGGQLMLLFYDLAGTDLQNRAYIAAQKIKFELENTILVEISVGISDCKTTADALLYRQAAQALGQRTLYPQNGVFLYQNSEENSPAISPQDVHLVNLYIAQRKLEHLRELLAGRLREYAGQMGLANAVKRLVSVVVQSLIENYGCHVFEVSDALLLSVEKLGAMTDVERLVGRIVQVIQEFFLAHDISPQGDQTITRRVREYIDQHYSEDISVRALAERFNINYSYLSSLFAKEMGVGIAAYGVGVRMEAAQKLLCETTSDIASVAAMVGYEDLQYFYRVFKKQTGLTPLLFRNRTKKVQ